MAEPSRPIRVRLAGTELTLQPDKAWTIGRDPSCDVEVADPRVSRRHAVLEASADGWVLRDAGSSNGTFRDGERVTEASVGSGLRVRLGGVDGPELVVDAVAPPEAEAPAAEAPAAEAPAAEAPEPPAKIEEPAPVASAPEAAPPAVLVPEAPVPPAPAEPAAPKPPSGAEVTPPAAAAVAAPGRIRIGRAPDNDVALTEDLRVSRRHAELVRNADGTQDVLDVGSANGTFVNGQRVKSARLGEGDVVGIGNHQFRFVSGTLVPLETEGMAAFEGAGLTVKLEDGKVILNDLSFYLGPSQLLGVVGPSGSGKSTLLNAITGIRPATSGTVTFGGRDLYKSFEELRHRIGFVPQDDILHPLLTVRRALEYAAELRFPPDVDAQTRGKRVQEVMEELDISDRADLRIDRLSGGQRKRVSVALELLTKPSLLFLDEPTSGLDPGNERELMALLRDLANGGRTVVVVTHSTQSLHLCDRVLFMAPGGRLAYYGPSDQSLAYFASAGAGEFYSDVFTALEDRPTEDWAGRFKANRLYEDNVARPLEADAAARTGRVPAPLPPSRQQPWTRQFSVLTRRYVSLIQADRRYLLLLLIQAPAIGLVLLLAFGPRRLSSQHALEAVVLVTTLVLAMTWLGLINAIREIVKELPIYRRERSVGLSISAYLASKVSVLGLFTIMQAALLVLIGLGRQKIFQYLDPFSQGAPTDTLSFSLQQLDGTHGSFFSSVRFEIIFDVALIGLAAMALGLFVSALTNTADKALSIAPLLLVPQLVLTGGLYPITTVPLAQLKFLSSAFWGQSALGSTIDINTLGVPFQFATRVMQKNQNDPGFVQRCSVPLTPAIARRCQQDADAIAEGVQGDQNAFAKHGSKTWAVSVGALMLLTVLGVGGAYWALRRRDLTVLVSGPSRIRGLLGRLSPNDAKPEPARPPPPVGARA